MKRNIALNELKMEIVSLIDEILLNGGLLKEELADCLGISLEELNGLLMNGCELTQVPVWLDKLRGMGKATSLC